MNASIIMNNILRPQTFDINCNNTPSKEQHQQFSNKKEKKKRTTSTIVISFISSIFLFKQF
jgi:hypothetical protein